MILVKSVIPSVCSKASAVFSSKVMVLPCAGITFTSGSKMEENERLKSFRPENPESTINKAAEPATILMAEIRVMIFIALLLLLVNR